MAIAIAGSCMGFGESSHAADYSYLEEEQLIEEEISDISEDPSEDASEDMDDIEISAEESSEESTEELSEEIILEESIPEEITPEENASEENSLDEAPELTEDEGVITLPGGDEEEGPRLYSKAPGRWIKKDKKWTYINAKGEKADDKGNSLKNTLAYIGEKYYYFKNNYMVTGFLYFDKEGNLLKNNKSDKIYYARYFDPVSGIMQYDWFIVNGKDYYASRYMNDYGQIPINQVFSLGVHHRYITDKTGAILKNQFVTLHGNTFFVQEDGRILEEYIMAINGKLCRFDYAGMIIIGASASNHFYKKDGKNAVEAYMKSKNPKKPEEGVYFYTDESCKEKLTEAWLYKEQACGDDSRTYYIDKNGEAVTGIYTVEEATYCFDLETCMLKSDYRGSYKVGSNLYFCDHGIVPTTPGFYTGGDGYRYALCYVLNKTGKIATGFITVWSDVYREKKRYYFDEEGKITTYLQAGPMTILL